MKLRVSSTKSVVESVLLYGAEILGCHQKLEGLSHIQLRTLCIYFSGMGVRSLTFPDDGG